jgi:hypothetical protein
MSTVTLRPTTQLDDDWAPMDPLLAALEDGDIELAYISGRGRARQPVSAAQRAKREAQEVKIKVAPGSDSHLLSRDSRTVRFTTRLGMNMVVPSGRVDELRYKVILRSGSEETPKVIDGFPNSQVKNKHIVKGTISFCLTDALQFLPMVPPLPVKIALGPWDFQFGRMRKISINFSGPLSPRPDWYFRAEGIKDELGVWMLIEAPGKAAPLTAEVTAMFKYQRTFLGVGYKSSWETDSKVVPIEVGAA